MATVTVFSELVETDGSETEEFTATAIDIAVAVDVLIEAEKRVAEQDWIAYVIFNCTQYFDADGFSFTIYDDGSGVNYRYVFTA